MLLSKSSSSLLLLFFFVVVVFCCCGGDGGGIVVVLDVALLRALLDVLVSPGVHRISLLTCAPANRGQMWTKAMKYMLTNLKVLLAWTARQTAGSSRRSTQ